MCDSFPHRSVLSQSNTTNPRKVRKRNPSWRTGEFAVAGQGRPNFDATELLGLHQPDVGLRQIALDDAHRGRHAGGP